MAVMRESCYVHAVSCKTLRRWFLSMKSQPLLKQRQDELRSACQSGWLQTCCKSFNNSSCRRLEPVTLSSCAKACSSKDVNTLTVAQLQANDSQGKR